MLPEVNNWYSSWSGLRKSFHVITMLVGALVLLFVLFFEIVFPVWPNARGKLVKSWEHMSPAFSKEMQYVLTKEGKWSARIGPFLVVSDSVGGNSELIYTFTETVFYRLDGSQAIGKADGGQHPFPLEDIVDQMMLDGSMGRSNSNSDSQSLSEKVNSTGQP